MTKLVEMTGRTFGRLVVLRRAEVARNGDVAWLCRCACGVTKVIVGRSLRKGTSQSCGCLRREIAADRIRPYAGSTKLPEEIRATRKRAARERTYDKCRASDQPGFIYYFQCGERAIKIGFSTKPAQRLREVQCGAPFALRPIAVVRGTKRDETALHRLFRKHRLMREWFDIRGIPFCHLFRAQLMHDDASGIRIRRVRESVLTAPPGYAP